MADEGKSWFLIRSVKTVKARPAAVRKIFKCQVFDRNYYMKRFTDRG